MNTEMPTYRVGYLLAEKKYKKFRIDELTRKCRNKGIELIQINIDADLEEQGPFDLIFHKFAEAITYSSLGDNYAIEITNKLENYIHRHPDTVLLDAIQPVRRILDRRAQYRMARHCASTIGPDVFVPEFVEIPQSSSKEDIKQYLKEGIRYPFIVKSFNAQAADECHMMSLIFNEEGLADMKFPCVVQNFVNHNATLYKIYCIGHFHYAVQRKSIKNFNSCDKKTIVFDSRTISKEASASKLSEVEPQDIGKQVMTPNSEKVKNIVELMLKECQLNFMGIDMIIEDETGRYGIIDINYFPGYDGIPDFHGTFMDFLSEQLRIKNSQSVLNS